MIIYFFAKEKLKIIKVKFYILYEKSYYLLFNKILKIHLDDKLFVLFCIFKKKKFINIFNNNLFD